MAGDKSRHVQREWAFQALYGQEFLECTTLDQLKEAFLAMPRKSGDIEIPEDTAEFGWNLVKGVWHHREELDAIIEKFALNWRLERVGRVEINLLRLGVFEILYCEDIPAKVSINEALDLDKQYGDPHSKKFVNGILDSVSKAIEKGELTRKG